MFNLMLGPNNIAIGRRAMYQNQGDDCIAIGIYAGYNCTNGNFNIHIGNEGTASDTSTIRIGSDGLHDRLFFPSTISKPLNPNMRPLYMDITTGEVTYDP
jgi:hypothetical protein